MAGITNTIQSLDTYCPNLLLIQLGHFYQIKMLLPTPCILPIWLCPHYSGALRTSRWLTHGDPATLGLLGEHWFGNWEFRGFLS